MSPRFTVAVRAGRDCHVLSLSGELDLGVVDDLRRALSGVVIERPLPRLVVDLTELRFIDSVGLGVLVQADRSCTARDQTMALVIPAGHVRRVFRTTGLEQRLRIVANLDEALDGV